MLNYLKKFTMDILPSVAATIIGAYIVNHYIVTKPGADAPVAAAVSVADPKAEAKSADVGHIPAAGIKAKGISEKAMIEKTAAEKPASAEKPQEKADAKVDAKSADAPAETASIPADPRRHPSAPREKAVVRVVLPSPIQPVAPAVAVVTTPAAPVEAAVAPVPDDRRDANDLARAAIERLRGNNDKSPPRAQEAARIPEAPRGSEPRASEMARGSDAPPAATNVPAMRPLPPPIMVSTPAAEALDHEYSPARPPYAAGARIDPSRPTPPADIPSRPLDLRAEAVEAPPAREHTTVAEDMLSAAKSVFHAVLPK